MWVAGRHRDCLLAVRDAELLVRELRRLSPDLSTDGHTAASLIEGAVRDEGDAPAVSFDNGQRQAALRALEGVMQGRREFSEGLNDLLEGLLEND